MKILFVNPHRSDFVYISPLYRLVNRKSLRKYKYLISFFESNDTEFLYSTSSFYRIIHNYFFDFFILKLEQFFFNKINEIKNNFRYTNSDIYDVVFCFGFAIRDVDDKEFKKIAVKGKKVIIHLSHYHLYAKKITFWSEFANVSFCADANITQSYFYKFYINNDNPFFVLSYTIDASRYLNKVDFDDRNPGIISTGTFHEFEKIYTLKYLKINLISSMFGFLSIHPERRIISIFRDKLPHVDCFNSSMGTISFRNIFRSQNSVNQSKYFSFDIVEKFNNYQFSFVGEESIVGLPAIGIFESIMCGCIPIINDFCYFGTPLEGAKIPIIYNNINHLISIIQDFKLVSSGYIFDKKEFENLRRDVVNFYSDAYQISSLNHFLNK